jgi:hypothetical protein
MIDKYIFLMSLKALSLHYLVNFNTKDSANKRSRNIQKFQLYHYWRLKYTAMWHFIIGWVVPKFWRDYHASKCGGLLAHWHYVTSHTTCIPGNAVVRTSSHTYHYHHSHHYYYYYYCYYYYWWWWWWLLCDIMFCYSVTHYTKLITVWTQLNSILFVRTTCLWTWGWPSLGWNMLFY